MEKASDNRGNHTLTCSLSHAYRLDGRSPKEIISSGGFAAKQNSALGAGSHVFESGSAFCAAECLQHSIPLKKRQLTSKVVFDTLQYVIMSTQATIHIYYINMLGITCARYIDNISLFHFTSGSSLPTMMYNDQGGACRVLVTEENINPNHSASEIPYDRVYGIYYDFPFRARMRAITGEIYIPGQVPTSRISYGGCCSYKNTSFCEWKTLLDLE